MRKRRLFYSISEDSSHNNEQNEVLDILQSKIFILTMWCSGTASSNISLVSVQFITINRPHSTLSVTGEFSFSSTASPMRKDIWT